MRPCPFCAGMNLTIQHELREGYAGGQEDDQDSTAYWVQCGSCSARGGWMKSSGGAERMWNLRAQP